jgi:DNA (cytosine-5)-methyltransferase 1
MTVMSAISVLELCAGAGGQALGFEQAGFTHVGLVELDAHACKTLRFNRPEWNVIEENLNTFDARPLRGRVDVVAAGLPCPSFSKAGKQLGKLDERNLFPAALRIIEKVQPRAVIIENVRGILDAVLEDSRN